MSDFPFAAIILAAGKGTRMKSSLPKVLHQIACEPMVNHVIRATTECGPQQIVGVIAPDATAVEQAMTAQDSRLRCVVQHEQRGTGDAVKSTEPVLKNFDGDIIILFGDSPLITSNTIGRALAALHADGAPSVVVVGMRPEDPTGYGRLIVNDHHTLERIVEQKDASDSERAIKLCNSGIMAVRGNVLFDLLSRLSASNAQGEYYLTDIVAIARSDNLECRVIEAAPDEMVGVNSRQQLAEAEFLIQQRLRNRVMEHGATLTDPNSVFLCADTILGKDVIIHPNVCFGPGVTIGDNVEIRAFSHLEGATITGPVTIGPFARLRPGTVVDSNARIGNFVEIKNAHIAEGAKVNHLSYVGDSEIGRNANLGAGTITCNYDGYTKSRTIIGEQAFIGSNTALVAPVSVGDGAIIGAGSVVTENVEADALCVARERQQHSLGWAKDFRAKKESGS